MFYPFASAPRARTAVAQALCVSAALHAVMFALILNSRTPRLTSTARGVGEHVHFTELPYSPDAPLRASAQQRPRRSASLRRTSTINLPDIQHFDELLLVPVQQVSFSMVVDSMVATMRAMASNGVESGADAGGARATVEGDNADTYTASTVDADATPVPENPKPPYPNELLRLAVEAHFSVYFVVDTAGKVDEATIEVPMSVRSQFANAVRSVLGRWHFMPAQRRGRRVRQLMEQPFIFRIDENR